MKTLLQTPQKNNVLGGLMLDFGMTFLVELNCLHRYSKSTELKVLISKPRDKDIRLFQDLKIHSCFKAQPPES